MNSALLSALLVYIVNAALELGWQNYEAIGEIYRVTNCLATRSFLMHHWL